MYISDEIFYTVLSVSDTIVDSTSVSCTVRSLSFETNTVVSLSSVRATDVFQMVLVGWRSRQLNRDGLAVLYLKTVKSTTSKNISADTNAVLNIAVLSCK
jgi:hypothetical protein